MVAKHGTCGTGSQRRGAVALESVMKWLDEILIILLRIFGPLRKGRPVVKLGFRIWSTCR